MLPRPPEAPPRSLTEGPATARPTAAFVDEHAKPEDLLCEGTEFLAVAPADCEAR